jgi:hypothetical protein
MVSDASSEAPLPDLTEVSLASPQRRKVQKVDRVAAGCASVDPSIFGKCRAIPTREAEATANDGKTTPALAFDRDRCTLWNAGGFHPQAVRARLGADATVVAVVFVPEMTPGGASVHEIELRGGPEEETFVVSAQLESEATYVVALDHPVAARSLTVRSRYSPSWIAFREIVPIACDGPLDLSATRDVAPAPAPPPDPGPQPHDENVPGVGFCNTAADCGPSECCHAKTCNAAGQRPRCDGIGCSQNVAPNTLDMGECTCVNHRCGAMIHHFMSKSRR